MTNKELKDLGNSIEKWASSVRGKRDIEATKEEVKKNTASFDAERRVSPEVLRMPLHLI